MVGMLSRKEVDVSTAGLTHTYERGLAVDFTMGVLEDVVTLHIYNPAMRKNLKSTVKFAGFAEVFDLTCWLVILISMFVLSAAYVAVGFREGEGAVDNFASGVAAVYRSLLQLDCGLDSVMRRALSFKIFLVSVSAMSVVLFAFYTGDITAQMAVRDRPPTLRNFQDVLDAGVGVAVQPNSFDETYLKSAAEGSATARVYEMIMKNDNFGYTNDDFFAAIPVIDAILNDPGGFAIFSSYFASVPWFPEVLPLAHFEDTFASHLSFALQRDSEFSPLFRYHMTAMRQGGIMKKIRQRWLEREPRDSSSDIFVEDAAALEVDNLYFPSTVIVTGTALGFAILFLEVIMNKIKVLGKKKAGNDWE